MAANVTIIPARQRVGNRKKNEERPKLRVAAYCRVSTDSDEQATSYEAQIEHYTAYIQKNPEWELAGIFADDGLSGTDTRKRGQFNLLIEECIAGKIDMVITKSISRFARNTLDCLKYIRQLKDKNIPVFFEKENINTMDSKGEILLTIMASLAQQESQSLSQNVKLKQFCKENNIPLEKLGDIGEVSDGFHTFNSLYHQRLILSATLVNAFPHLAWKSHKHHDGEAPFGGGWFIVGIDTPEGQYTYHYQNKDWDIFRCQELDKAPEWDGHTDKDVERLLSLVPDPEKDTMSSWAAHEVELAVQSEKEATKGTDDWKYGVSCCESALRAFQCLARDNDDDIDIQISKSILNRLVDGQTLTPIEDTPDIWSDISEVFSKGEKGKQYQCKRMSSLFKKIAEDARPRHQIVEGRGAGAIIHRRIGVTEPGRSVSAGALGGPAAGPVPLHAVDGGELGRHCDGLVGGGLVVRTGRHLDGDGRRTAGLIDVVDGDSRPTHRSRRHRGVAGRDGDNAVARPGRRDGLTQVGAVQRHSRRAEAQTARRFADAPLRHFSRKPNRGTIFFEEMIAIVDALGSNYEQTFISPNGTAIKRGDKMEKICGILFSGGLDSSLAVCKMIEKGYRTELLHFDQGALISNNLVLIRYNELKKV